MEEKQKELQATVSALMYPSKGIVALDESTSTAGKRLESVGLENTEDNRRTYREIFIDADGMEEYVSGVILFDETIRQSDRAEKPFRDTLNEKGVVIGIKVDEGLEPVSDSSEETLTKGLDSLESRLPEYYELGARFAKWRAAIPVGEDIPTLEVVKENSIRMAKYALACQAAGIVPVVEPEVLMDGPHTQARQKQVVETALESLINELNNLGVWLPGVIIKTSMVVPGKESGEVIDEKKVAEDTVEVLTKTVPANIGGVVFLSGGQTTEGSLKNLSEIAKLEPLPFEIACSFARALQGPAMEAWQGRDENIPAAQTAFVDIVKQMSSADEGAY